VCDCRWLPMYAKIVNFPLFGLIEELPTVSPIKPVGFNCCCVEYSTAFATSDAAC